MKKNDWIYLGSIAVYSFLFWKEEPGLNFLVMNVLLIGGLLLMKKGLLRNRNWLLAAAGALVTAGCVAWYGGPLCVFANFASLLAVSSFAVNRNNSLIVAGVVAVCNIGASFVFMLSDGIERNRGAIGRESGSKKGKRLVIVLAAIVVALIFFFMYRESSLLFYKLTEKINLDFISFGWILFTLFGALVLYGYYYSRRIGWLNDDHHALQLVPPEKQGLLDKLMTIESEHFSGMVLLALLNVLLLVVNSLDASFMFAGNKVLPDGVTFTEYVHQGVGMLIFSIVLAMLIILYYFRGRLNFYEKNRGLRTLVMLWIVQNAFMLVTTMWRNHGYIHVYGLTYKRIGVDIYLLLALIGLATTAWKVHYRKTNMFLVRINSWLFYGVLVVSCTINWDKLIFNHNIGKASRTDIAYMNELSYTILPDLVEYERVHPFPAEESDRLRNRVFLFMNRQQHLHEQNRWPSMVYKMNEVFYRLQQERSAAETSLRMSSQGLEAIYFFPAFDKTRSLDVSNNELTALGEIPDYKELRILNLRGNEELGSLEGIGKLNYLAEIDIRDTGIRDLSPLLRLPALKMIRVSHISDEWMLRLQQAHPGLQIDESGYF